MRDLRQSHKAWLLNGEAGVCGLVWQGDFGSGQSTGSGTWGGLGVNPCVLSAAQPTGGTNNMVGGQPVRAFKLGDMLRGDYGTEFVYCRLVLAGVTDLLPGHVFQIDENFTAALATTATAVLSGPVGVGMVFQPAVAVGTYFIWLAVRGNIGVRAAAASLAGGVAETTATAGAVKFLINHTASSLTLNNLAASAASSNITFKGDTVNGSPTISNVTSQISLEGSLGGITDLLPGQTITGTGMPANACIAAIRRVANSWSIDIGTATTGVQKTLQNASATNAQTTITVTTLVQAVALSPIGATAVT